MGRRHREQTQSKGFCEFGSRKFKCSALDRPVETVQWKDAKAFCDKVSALPIFKDANLKVCLPSESQWEYACRDGANPNQKTKFWFGNNDGELPAIPNSERFCAISAISRNIKNHKPLLL